MVTVGTDLIRERSSSRVRLPWSSLHALTARNSRYMLLVIYLLMSSFFSSLDRSLTTILRNLGTQIAGQCPVCAQIVAAPIGARVRCVTCQAEFTTATAVDAIVRTGENVADSAFSFIQATGLVSSSSIAVSEASVEGGSTSSYEQVRPPPAAVPVGGTPTITRKPRSAMVPERLHGSSS
jgi:hypothetical protein